MGNVMAWIVVKTGNVEGLGLQYRPSYEHASSIDHHISMLAMLNIIQAC